MANYECVNCDVCTGHMDDRPSLEPMPILTNRTYEEYMRGFHRPIMSFLDEKIEYEDLRRLSGKERAAILKAWRPDLEERWYTCCGEGCGNVARQGVRGRDHYFCKTCWSKYRNE